jgi:hypothetical protein
MVEHGESFKFLFSNLSAGIPKILSSRAEEKLHAQSYTERLGMLLATGIDMEVHCSLF